MMLKVHLGAGCNHCTKSNIAFWTSYKRHVLTHRSLVRQNATASKSFVHTMACRSFRAKPSPKPVRYYQPNLPEQGIVKM